MRGKRKRGRKGELTWDTLAPWIIALGVLVLVLLLIGILTGKGGSALKYFKEIWRFGK